MLDWIDKLVQDADKCVKASVAAFIAIIATFMEVMVMVSVRKAVFATIIDFFKVLLGIS